jgi:hypothetical protein
MIIFSNKKIVLREWELDLIVLVLLALGIVMGIYMILSGIIAPSNAAPVDWTQTDWSGGTTSGTITGTVTTYESQTNIDTGTSGQLSVAEKQDWYDSNWEYRRSFTVDADQVSGSSNISDYILMFNSTSDSFKSIGNGGNIEQDNGGDILFTSSDGTTKLPHEIDYYDPVNGEILAWIYVSSLSYNSDTDFYIYFGNDAGGLDEQDLSGVWDDNYYQVSHLNEDPSGLAPQAADSAGGDDEGTSNGSMTTDDLIDAKIGKGYDFDGSNDDIRFDKPPSYYDSQDFTLSMWINPTNFLSARGFYGINNSSFYRGFSIITNTNGNLQVVVNNTGGTSVDTLTTSGSFSAGEDLLVTFKVDADGYELYVNGESEAVDDGAVAGIVYGDSSMTPIIGARTTRATFQAYFLGNISEFNIANYGKSTDQVATEYANQNNPGTFYSLSGSEETKYETSGSLVSNIFDTTFLADFDTLDYTSSGTGTVVVKVRSDSNSDMSGATDWASCTAVADTADPTTGGCADDIKRYLQYQVTLSSSGINSPIFEDIAITYDESDTAPPDTNATDIALTGLSDAGWTNTEPTITWTAGADDSAGVGLAGYCVSLDEATIDTPNDLDPEIAGGKLTGIDDGVGLAACPFIATGTSLDLASLSGLTLTTGEQYYFSIKAVDLAGNIWTGADNEFQNLISFKYDTVAPANPAFVSMPSNFISTKDVTLTWPTSGGNQASDTNSGLVGLQYRIGSGGTWYGDLHNGSQDITDYLTNDGAYTTDATYDYPVLVEGVNQIYLRAIDNAGNTSTPLNGVLKINTVAPSSPLNLDVTPSTSTTNSYSFNWDSPSTFSGLEGNITYCYSINTLPTSNTCNYTAAGVTSLSADAFATQPGSNTFYVVARDEASNINYATYESTTFTYSGSASGIPKNVDVADISDKTTASWKLAVSWGVPDDIGAGVSSYRIYRSATDTTCSLDIGAFSLHATVSGTSFIDENLTQQNYYYCVRACDSANSCSAVSGTDTEFPEGKYTEAASLVSEPVISSLTTRKAVMNWSTARRSDSRIQFGLSSGNYFDEEVGNSAQVTGHTVSLDNLTPGTVYYYRATWTDEDGNTGFSTEKSFATDPAPSVVAVDATNISIDRALITFTVRNASSATINYGLTESFGGAEIVSTSTVESTYSILLDGLQDGSAYFYTLILSDIDGFEYPTLETNQFTTLPRPRVSNVEVEEVKGTAQPTVRITWQSNTAISSILTYFPQNDPAATRDEIQIDLKTEHDLEIIGLLPNTIYQMTVGGRDIIGNEAISEPIQFTTATDSRPPTIANINADTSIQSSENSDNNVQLIISWDTDEGSTSKVEYGEGTSATFTNSTQNESDLEFRHVVVISNLKPSSVYHFRVISMDSAGNESISTKVVTITPQRTENALEIVLRGLGGIFSFL